MGRPAKMRSPLMCAALVLLSLAKNGVDALETQEELQAENIRLRAVVKEKDAKLVACETNPQGPAAAKNELGEWDQLAAGRRGGATVSSTPPSPPVYDNGSMDWTQCKSEGG